MEISAESLVRLSNAELLDAYLAARRLYAEKKFARDTEQGRLDWQSARMFVTSNGRVTERGKAIEASEEIARKGQQIRGMTKDMDLTKADMDVLALAIRIREASPPKPDSCAVERLVPSEPQT